MKTAGYPARQGVPNPRDQRDRPIQSITRRNTCRRMWGVGVGGRVKQKRAAAILEALTTSWAGGIATLTGLPAVIG